jgi:3',5'-cyclic AMP phosphodiesterase CpdA
MSLSLALTADLHWGHAPRGNDATRLLADFLRSRPPDILVVAGDVGTGTQFSACLDLFAGLGCTKALVPGNHDVWVAPDASHDSQYLYTVELPRIAAEHGFHYLDSGPLVLPAEGLALVGSMNWYDYSWALEALRRHFPTEEYRLASKRFTRGRHNDANFVRWPFDDPAFTKQAAQTLERHLDEALAKVDKVIVVTHHPPFRGISFPGTGRTDDLDALLWAAFGGNARVEDLLARRADRIAFAFCGHTHRERQGELGGIRGYNIGGDYHYKRLLWLDWPAGTIEAHTFGDPRR